MNYCYSTAQGIAVLNKGDDYKLIKLGKFKSEDEARKKCEDHYAKACATARKFSRDKPTAYYL